MQNSKLQFKIKNPYFLAIAFIFVFLVFNSGEVNAAELNLISQFQEIGIGQRFQVDLILDTENEEINAVEGKISFPADLLELKEIRDGNSIVNFWVERPRVESTNQIIFSGITPGGYIGEKGLIFSVIFQTKSEGEETVEIREAKTLLNDGKGTETSVKLSPFQFLISQEVPSAPLIVETVKDTEPPESFVLEIASDPNIFDGKYFLVFATQDKGSGIDHYEVCEGKRKCVVAESPYLLQNQSLDTEIVVKAIDKSANERVVTVPPQKPRPWYKDYAILAILITAVIAYLIWKFLWRKRRK